MNIKMILDNPYIKYLCGGLAGPCAKTTKRTGLSAGPWGRDTVYFSTSQLVPAGCEGSTCANQFIFLPADPTRGPSDKSACLDL